MGRAGDSLGQAELKAWSLSKKLSRKDCRKHEDKKGGGWGMLLVRHGLIGQNQSNGKDSKRKDAKEV